jgi:hypothetical protein
MADARGQVWQAVRGPAEGTIRAYGAATAGWRRSPDFLVIGGRRCGTTTLFYGLTQHPAVMPQVLSAGWLPLREHRKGTRWLDQPRRGGRWYRAHFPSDFTRRRYQAVHGAAITGEATPWYLSAPGTAERAARECPEARIIAVLREPARRSWSQFVEQQKRGHEPLSDFAAALAAEDDRVLAGVTSPGPVRRSPHFALEHLTYRYQSEYDLRLQPWLERFPRDRILVLQSEHLYADVAGTLRRVADFLDLPAFDFVTEHRNAAATGQDEPAAVAELRAQLRPNVRNLESLLDQPFDWE